MASHADDELQSEGTKGFKIGEKKTVEEYTKLGMRPSRLQPHNIIPKQFLHPSISFSPFDSFSLSENYQTSSTTIPSTLPTLTLPPLNHRPKRRIPRPLESLPRPLLLPRPPRLRLRHPPLRDQIPRPRSRIPPRRHHRPDHARIAREPAHASVHDQGGGNFSHEGELCGAARCVERVEVFAGG